jgi:hypothetical protein
MVNQQLNSMRMVSFKGMHKNKVFKVNFSLFNKLFVIKVKSRRNLDPF